MAALRASIGHSGSDRSPTVAEGLNTSSAPFMPNACISHATQNTTPLDSPPVLHCLMAATQDWGNVPASSLGGGDRSRC